RACRTDRTLLRTHAPRRWRRTAAAKRIARAAVGRRSAGGGLVLPWNRRSSLSAHGRIAQATPTPVLYRRSSLPIVTRGISGRSSCTSPWPRAGAVLRWARLSGDLERGPRRARGPPACDAMLVGTSLSLSG